MASIPSPRERRPVEPAAISVAHASMADLGLLAIRLIVGIVFIYHGSNKLFGPGGLSNFADMLAGMGVPLPMVSAVLSACTEFFGGIALVLGIGTRIAVIPMVFNMLMAILLVHRGAFDLRNNGMEYALTLGVVLLGLGFTGPGKLSLAGLLRHKSVRADMEAHE